MFVRGTWDILRAYLKLTRQWLSVIIAMGGFAGMGVYEGGLS